METAKKKLRNLNIILNVYSIVGVIFCTIAVVLFLAPSFPHIWYRINPKAINNEIETIVEPTNPSNTTSTAFNQKITKSNQEMNNQAGTLPPLDKSLSEHNKLIIPKIGVNGKIYEGQNAAKVMEKGAWRVNDFGTPEDNITMIIASHRFGHISWDKQYRRKNSFYNLPATKVGDEIEIIWNQRKYKYEIYLTEDNVEITDYEADLILYTCRLYDSPIRVFRYARRVN